MKVEGPSKSGKVSKTKSKTGKSGQGSGFDKLVSGAAGDSAGASGVSSSSPVSAVDALLAVQETADATSGKSRAKARAEVLLQKLDELRMGLLAGAIPRKTLVDLTRVINMRRDQIDDANLTEILDEIDLRAQVELAKLEVAAAAERKKAEDES